MTDPDDLIADLGISRHRGYALDEGEQDHVVPFLLRVAKDAKGLSAQFGDKP
jgi:hypothetical protein